MDAATALHVLHSDSDLLVAVKPPGLPSVPGRPAELQDCLASRLAVQWPEVRVVHRLDMATSGLMVFALNRPAQIALSRAFEDRSIHKRYEACVRGPWLQGEQGEIDLPLAADWPRRPMQKVCHQTGRPSRTRWWRKRSSPAAAEDWVRLSLEPITGRTHQLRVHLASVGHAIVGDSLYGCPSLPSSRLMLHACGLRLRHPSNAEMLDFTDPPDF